jgi:type I restriction enzyme, S subunit
VRELPRGWATSSLGTVTINRDGRRIPLRSSDRATRQGFYPYYGAQGIIDHLDDYLFDGTYLLIAEDGANLVSRSQPIAQIAHGKFWVNNHAHVVEPAPGMDIRFLMHFLNGNPLTGAVRGTAQPKLTQADLNRLLTPTPPLAEQERIVAAIEEQFSRLDAGVIALERVRQNLRRMRASVLDELVGFTTSAALPDGWSWVTIRDTAGTNSSPVLTGPFGTALSRSDFRENGIPVLTIGCLTDHGIQKENAPRVSDAKAQSLQRYALAAGDILFSRMATVGRAAVVGPSEDGCLINYHLMRLRLDQSLIHPEYLALLCRGSRAIHQYLIASNHGVTRPGINTKQLLALPVALPPLQQQKDIVYRVKGADDYAAVLDGEISLATRRASGLRASILTAAFSGKLVPQNTSDEPASVLLERIAAERSTSYNHQLSNNLRQLRFPA